jgi:hypothetical protein
VPSALIWPGRSSKSGEDTAVRGIREARRGEGRKEVWIGTKGGRTAASSERERSLIVVGETRKDKFLDRCMGMPRWLISTRRTTTLI